jgi:hypothetical protein
MEDWSGHGTSKASWLAILGPNIEKTGLVEGEFFTNQIAETIMQISKKRVKLKFLQINLFTQYSINHNF